MKQGFKILISMYGLHHAVLLSRKIALKEAFSAEEMSQVNCGKTVACCGFPDQGMC